MFFMNFLVGDDFFSKCSIFKIFIENIFLFQIHRY